MEIYFIFWRVTTCWTYSINGLSNPGQSQINPPQVFFLILIKSIVFIETNLMVDFVLPVVTDLYYPCMGLEPPWLKSSYSLLLTMHVEKKINFNITFGLFLNCALFLLFNMSVLKDMYIIFICIFTLHIMYSKLNVMHW